MRIVLWATFAKVELIGRLQALLGGGLTVVANLEELGATVIVLQNNSGADPLKAIEVYGSEVLPALRGVRA